jgi:hypothetical protein
LNPPTPLEEERRAASEILRFKVIAIVAGIVGGLLVAIPVVVYGYLRQSANRRERRVRGDSSSVPRRSIQSRLVAVLVGVVLLGVAVLVQVIRSL